MDDLRPSLLEFAVRENATWCDLVCRLSRLAPVADADVWSTPRRPPTRYPDAVTLTATAQAFEVLSRIDDSPGASVKDSFSSLDLGPNGYSVLFDATWIARPPPQGPPASATAGLEKVADKFTLAAWRRATAAPEGALPNGLLRAAGVTILGGATGDGFDVGAILHRTRIGGSDVVGLSNAFGSIGAIADEAAVRFPDAWIVGYEDAASLTDAIAHGFMPVGQLRVWSRSP